jgi:hypothetical protein
MLSQYEKLGLFAVGMAAFVFIAPRALSFVLGGAALMVTPPSRLPGAGVKGREAGRRAAPPVNSAPGFSETMVEEAGGDWLAAEAVNAAVERLRARRAAAVTREGALRSKVAWKIAVSQQAALYHLVALADGAALLWNARNPVAAALAARGVVEATVVLADFARRLEAPVAAGDLPAADALVMAHGFSSALLGLADAPQTGAEGIAALLARCAADLPGAGAVHAQLSALAGAEASAQFGAFGMLDKTSTGVAFRDAESFDKSVLAQILAGLEIVTHAEFALAAVDGLASRVAALEEKTSF